MLLTSWHMTCVFLKLMVSLISVRSMSHCSVPLVWLLRLASSLKSSSEKCQVEQASFTPHMDKDAVVGFLEGVGQEQGEDDAEKGWSKNTILLHTNSDWERLRVQSIKLDDPAHILARGYDNALICWGRVNNPSRLITLKVKELSPLSAISSAAASRRTPCQWLT